MTTARIHVPCASSKHATTWSADRCPDTATTHPTASSAGPSQWMLHQDHILDQNLINLRGLRKSSTYFNQLKPIDKADQTD